MRPLTLRSTLLASTPRHDIDESLWYRRIRVVIVAGALVASTASAQTNIQINTNGTGFADYGAFTANAGPFPFTNFGVGAKASLGGTTVNVGISGATTFSFPDFTDGQVLQPYITSVGVGYTPSWGGSISSTSGFSANANFQYDIGPFSGSKDIFSQNLNTSASASLAPGNALASGKASDTATGSVYTFKLGESAVFASASVGINVGANYTNSVQYDPTAQYGITSWVSTTQGGGPVGAGAKTTSTGSGSLDPGIFNPGGFSTGDQVYLEFEPSVTFDMPVTPLSDLSMPLTGTLSAEALGETLANYTFPIANLFDLPVSYDPWDVNVVWNSGFGFGIPATYEHQQSPDGTCGDPQNNCNVFVVDGLAFNFAAQGFGNSGPGNLTNGGDSGFWNPIVNSGSPLPKACDSLTGMCYASTDPNMPIGTFTVVSSVTQANPNSAPEPGSLALLGVGLVGMVVGARRRSRAFSSCEP